jgi:hypothetical protein
MSSVFAHGRQAERWSRTSRGLWRRCKTWRCFVEWVRDAVAESKQEGSGQHCGKRATPPDGVWCAL